MVNIPNLMEPLTKLIEVIAAGCGRFYEPYQMRRLADAEAYKITKLAEANSESQRIQAKLEYKSQDEEGTSEKSVADRALIRRTHQELKKQVNIEQIAQQAAKDLHGEQSVSPEPVDEDWISRYFSIAEDITSEEMQRLWGKVLAGEVKQPGSYSLRTLDLLKDISRQDAEVFMRAAQFAFGDGDRFAMLRPDNLNGINNRLEFTDILLLRELGLVTSDVVIDIFPALEKVTTAFPHHNKVIILEKEAGSPKQQLPIIGFTRIGKELLPLIDIEPNLPYMHRIGSLLKSKGNTVRIADITRREGNRIHYINAQEI